MLGRPPGSICGCGGCRICLLRAERLAARLTCDRNDDILRAWNRQAEAERVQDTIRGPQSVCRTWREARHFLAHQGGNRPHAKRIARKASLDGSSRH